MPDRTNEELVAACVAPTAAAVASAPEGGDWHWGPEAHRRRLLESLAGQSLGRLGRFLDRLGRSASSDVSVLGASQTETSAQATFASPEGVVFRLTGDRTNAPEGAPFRELTLERLDPADPEQPHPDRLAVASLHRMETLARLGMESLSVGPATVFPGESQALFGFLDLVRPLLAPEDAMEVGALMLDPELKEAVEADGGLPGATWRTVVEAVEDMLAKEALRRARPMLEVIETKARNAGLVWGEAYLSWGDCDRNVCVLPGGRSVFVENIDLISDHSSYVATLGTDADGDVTTITSLSRSSLDRHAFLSSFDPGARPEGTSTMRYRHGSDVLEIGSDGRAASLPEATLVSVPSNFEAVSRYAAGTLPMGSGNRVERDFSHYRPDFDPDEEDDSPSPGF